MTERISEFFASLIKDDRSRIISASAGTTTVLLSAWLFRDQRRWSSFDTGGSPPTWYGYSRMTILRIMRLLKGGSLTDHYPLSHTGTKCLRETIEPRQGKRPTSREWVLPQRLEPCPEVPPEVFTRIFSWTEKFVKENPDMLEYRLSATEGLSAPAVYAKTGLSTRNPEANDKLLGDEIFHAHPEDGSLHIWLSEADLKNVVSRRWGERFPFSAMGLSDSAWGFVYTPRTMAECDIVEEIIRAGIEFVTGQKPKA